MICEFVDGVCTRCKIASGVAKGKKVVRECEMTRCDHYGSARSSMQVPCGDKKASQLAAICKEHGRCLPSYRPNRKSLAAWVEQPESELYHLCYNCKEFKAKE